MLRLSFYKLFIYNYLPACISATASRTASAIYLSCSSSRPVLLASVPVSVSVLPPQPVSRLSISVRQSRRHIVRFIIPLILRFCFVILYSKNTLPSITQSVFNSEYKTDAFHRVFCFSRPAIDYCTRSPAVLQSNQKGLEDGK